MSETVGYADRFGKGDDVDGPIPSAVEHQHRRSALYLLLREGDEVLSAATNCDSYLPGEIATAYARHDGPGLAFHLVVGHIPRHCSTP